MVTLVWPVWWPMCLCISSRWLSGVDGISGSARSRQWKCIEIVWIPQFDPCGGQVYVYQPKMAE